MKKTRVRRNSIIGCIHGRRIAKKSSNEQLPSQRKQHLGRMLSSYDKMVNMDISISSEHQLWQRQQQQQ